MAGKTFRSTVQVSVNGEPRDFDGPPHSNALDFLRGQGLTAAKEGCAEGECGACAIMVARPDNDGTTRWTSMNSCLLPAASLDGQEVVTAEGLANGHIHPVQHEMAVRGGSQCGYCTPGFICSMAAEFYRPERAEDTEGACDSCGPNGFDPHALSGNLCRCTGYRPILEAAYALEQPTSDDEFAARRDQPAPVPVATDYSAADTASGKIGRFRRPATLDEALEILAAEPETQLVSGATDFGVEVNLKHARARSVLAIDRLPELRGIRRTDDYIELGASHTLSELERELDGEIPLLCKLFPQFASRLIRNAATIGGNLGTGSPIGDTPPALLALEAKIVLSSVRGQRIVELAEFFTGYRQTVAEPDELISAVRIPVPLAPLTSFQKISKRRYDDISSVAIGHAMTVEDNVITHARIGLGGVAATPIRARKTEAELEGAAFTLDTIREVSHVLATEGTPMDDHRASAKYRTAMLRSSLERFYAQHLDMHRDLGDLKGANR